MQLHLKAIKCKSMYILLESCFLNTDICLLRRTSGVFYYNFRGTFSPGLRFRDNCRQYETEGQLQKITSLLDNVIVFEELKKAEDISIKRIYATLPRIRCIYSKHYSVSVYAAFLALIIRHWDQTVKSVVCLTCFSL